jgi:hypothetical protein
LSDVRSLLSAKVSDRDRCPEKIQRRGDQNRAATERRIEVFASFTEHFRENDDSNRNRVY